MQRNTYFSFASQNLDSDGEDVEDVENVEDDLEVCDNLIFI